jgi:hypothetical protein
MLALSEDGEHFFGRERSFDFSLDDNILYSRWVVLRDVSIETWLIPYVPWHIRIHRIRTDRQLQSAESGFAIARNGNPAKQETNECRALIIYPDSWSGLIDLAIESKANRHGEVVHAEPNTNLLNSRTLIPTLLGVHEPGEHWLACAVIAVPGSTDPDRYWQIPPWIEMNYELMELLCKAHNGRTISTFNYAVT